jgi:hypothetical protein
VYVRKTLGFFTPACRGMLGFIKGLDVPSSNHDFMVELCSMKVQIFMQKFCPSSSMELHPLENPRIIFYG